MHGRFGRVPAALPITIGAAAALGLLSATTPARMQPPPQQPVSRTAVEVACARAFMARNPDPATRNPDQLAEKMLDAELRALAPGCQILDRPFADALRERLETPTGFLLYGILIRTKHIDAALEAALARGVDQVVILGAGFDTRAYRMATGHDDVRFFEVDLPATQNDKTARVRRLFGELPSSVAYVPIDFETQTLAGRLMASGFDETRPALFVWEGVTMYLDEAAVDGVLRFVADRAAPGSSIIFDYVLASIIQGIGPEPTEVREARVERLSEFGEPWVFGIAGGQTRAFVESRGLELVSDSSVAELYPQYVGRSIPDEFQSRAAAFRMAVARVAR